MYDNVAHIKPHLSQNIQFNSPYMTSVTSPHSAMSVKSPPSEYKDSTGRGDVKNHLVVDVVLRVILFATSLIGIIVMVTSKQTKLIPVAPGLAIPMAAEFAQSPAFIYYVAALSVACLYSIISGVISVLMLKPRGSSIDWLFHFLMLDVLLLGIMASATGAAGGVAYIGYKGNSHTRWNEVCNMYDSFCGHIAASVTLSLLPSVALVLLIWLSGFMLSKKMVR